MLEQGVLRPVEACIVITTETPVPVSIVGAARSQLGVPVSDHVVLTWAGIANTTACGQTSGEAVEQQANLSRPWVGAGFDDECTAPIDGLRALLSATAHAALRVPGPAPGQLRRRTHPRRSQCARRRPSSLWRRR